MLLATIVVDARLQNGATHRAAGGYTGHAWCVINIHGVDYVFDPQVEDNIAAGGAIRHLRFCKTYEEVPDKYIRYADDVVQDSIMAGGDVGPAYFFGQGGGYLLAVNEARAAAGVAPLAWDVDLARAALRIAMGEDSDTVLDELERQTGKRCAYYSSYGMYPLPSWGPNLESFRKSAGISFYGSSVCMLYSMT